MSLGLTDMSHVSIFNDFNESDDEYHGRIIDQFTMITVDAQLITMKVLWVLVLMIWE